MDWLGCWCPGGVCVCAATWQGPVAPFHVQLGAPGCSMVARVCCGWVGLAPSSREVGGAERRRRRLHKQPLCALPCAEPRFAVTTLFSLSRHTSSPCLLVLVHLAAHAHTLPPCCPCFASPKLSRALVSGNTHKHTQTHHRGMSHPAVLLAQAPHTARPPLCVSCCCCHHLALAVDVDAFSLLYFFVYAACS